MINTNPPNNEWPLIGPSASMSKTLKPHEITEKNTRKPYQRLYSSGSTPHQKHGIFSHTRSASGIFAVSVSFAPDCLNEDSQSPPEGDVGGALVIITSVEQEDSEFSLVNPEGGRSADPD